MSFLFGLANNLLLLAGIFETTQDILYAILAILNGVLAMIATIAIWQSYLVTGVKIALTALVVIPILGIIAYFVWGRKKVAKST